MTKMEVKVTGAALTVQVTGPLTGGMVGVPVLFSFDESWEGLTKTAVFRAGGASIDRVAVEKETTIPWEVMQKKNCTLQIGVFGCSADGTLVIPTVWGQVGVIQSGADPSGDESTDPSLPVWAQLEQRVKGLEDNPEIFIAKYNVTKYDSIVAAYNAGKVVLCSYGAALHKITSITNTNVEFCGLLSTDMTYRIRCTSKNAWTITRIDLVQDTTFEHKLDQINEKIDTLGTIFIAEYDVTTFAQMEEAYNAGKMLFCRTDGYIVPMYQFVEGTSVSFYRVTASCIVNYYRTASGVWKNKQIPLSV